jgi:hypothetical protein
MYHIFQVKPPSREKNGSHRLAVVLLKRQKSTPRAPRLANFDHTKRTEAKMHGWPMTEDPRSIQYPERTHEDIHPRGHHGDDCLRRHDSRAQRRPAIF